MITTKKKQFGSRLFQHTFCILERNQMSRRMNLAMRKIPLSAKAFIGPKILWRTKNSDAKYLLSFLLYSLERDDEKMVFTDLYR
jgi:hypothetical protein